MKSLTTPEDIFYKSRRFVLLSSLLIFLTFYAHLSFDDSEASISIFKLKMENPEALPTVFLLMLFYSLWQFIAAWFVQTDEVRKSKINRIDFSITFVVAAVAIVYYLYNVIEVSFDIHILTKLGVVFALLPALSAQILDIIETVRRKLDKKIRNEELEVETLLISNRWKLIYNPQTGQHKEIEFLDDGNVGKGKNDHETTWRVREGLLEILDSKGNIFSRFRYDRDDNEFLHTNDIDTLSKRNQLIRRSFAD